MQASTRTSPTCCWPRFGEPVLSRAGGIGLCELVQHLATFDYVTLSGTTEHRPIESIDNLHEHFSAAAAVVDGYLQGAIDRGRLD